MPLVRQKTNTQQNRDVTTLQRKTETGKNYQNSWYRDTGRGCEAAERRRRAPLHHWTHGCFEWTYTAVGHLVTRRSLSHCEALHDELSRLHRLSKQTQRWTILLLSLRVCQPAQLLTKIGCRWQTALCELRSGRSWQSAAGSCKQMLSADLLS